MKKRRLNLENITVESFETEHGTGTLRGTVHGHASIYCSENPDHTCDVATCVDEYTCRFLSCPDRFACEGGSGAADSCVLSYCPPFC
ncbi:MAG TPA: hypothetical protein VFJ82_03640 [Longimicrobium sp.]|nr:hypothetical protein [Longimicrobium sp.]